MNGYFLASFKVAEKSPAKVVFSACTNSETASFTATTRNAVKTSFFSNPSEVATASFSIEKPHVISVEISDKSLSFKKIIEEYVEFIDSEDKNLIDLNDKVFLCLPHWHDY